MIPRAASCTKNEQRLIQTSRIQSVNFSESSEDLLYVLRTCKMKNRFGLARGAELIAKRTTLALSSPRLGTAINFSPSDPATLPLCCCHTCFEALIVIRINLWLLAVCDVIAMGNLTICRPEMQEPYKAKSVGHNTVRLELLRN